MEYVANPGRNIKVIAKDKNTGKVLGMMSLGSDVTSIAARDNFIGWTRQQRNEGRLKHTCIGSTILPTQPLGYNYVGGKLLALLCLSDEVQNEWKRRYGQTLVGVTTTSLYGSFSQYNNLKYWNKRGKSSGSIVFEPTRDTLYKVRDWVHKRDPVKYWEWYFALDDRGNKLKRDHKFRMLNWVYSQLKIKDTKTFHQRGIYFSHLYENTAEFLIMCQENKHDLVFCCELISDIEPTFYDKLAKYIKNITKKNNIPCFEVLGTLISDFSKLLKQKANRKPSGQHALNKDYYKRIEAVQFTISHDDGKVISDLDNSDVVLVGISRTSKTPTSI